MKTILGKKMGMTQIFDENGNVTPVTVIEACPEVVTQVKTVETDGYNAVQVGFEDQKPQRVNKPRSTSLNSFLKKATHTKLDRLSLLPSSKLVPSWTSPELPKVRAHRVTSRDITTDVVL